MNQRYDAQTHAGSGQNSDEDNPLKGIDIRRFVLALIHKWPLIVTIFAVFLVLGLIAGISLRGKIFKARAVVLYTNTFNTETPETAFSLSSIDLGTIVSTIKLPKNIEIIMDHLNINSDPSDFAGNIDVVVNRGSDIVAITGTGGSPQEAADIANTTLRVFLQSQKDLRSLETNEALARFNKQLAALDKQYSNVVKEIEQFRKDNGISNLESETEQYLMRKAEMASTLEQNELTVATIEARLAKMSAKGGGAGNSGRFPQSGARYNELTSELARLRALYTENHPKIIQIKAELRGFSKNSGKGGASQNQSAALKRQLSALDSERIALKKTLGELNSKMENLTAAEKKYGSLIEKKELLKGAITRRKAEQQDATVLSNELPDEFRVLEKAKPPTRASASKAKLVALAIPILGLFIAIFTVLIRELTDQTIQSPKELEGGIGLKVLGIHPHYPGMPNNLMSLKETNPYEMAISALFADDTLKLNKTIGVISVLPKAGQSTVAENFAQILGKRGHSVLLIRQNAASGQQEKLEFAPSVDSPDLAYRTIEFNSLGELLSKFSAAEPAERRDTFQTHVEPEPRPTPQKSVPPFAWLPESSSNPIPNARIIVKGSEVNSGPGRMGIDGPVAPERPSFDHLIIDPRSLYEEPKTIELFSEIDVAIVAVRAGQTKKKQLKKLVAQLEQSGTKTVGAVLLDTHIFYCDEQIRMTVSKRPIHYGRNSVERFFVKKLLLL